MRIFPVLTLAAGIALGACGDPNFLGPAQSTNEITTVRLWAIQGTPIHLPSAWSVAFRTRIRLDQTADFDFAFDIDAAGRPVLLPLGTIGLPRTTGSPGLIPTPLTWDAITAAQVNGYVVDDTIPIAVGDRLFVRSAISTISSNTYPLYGKVEIQEIDLIERSVGFRILTNLNCGYKSLEPGLPAK